MALDNFIPKNACKQCNKCKHLRARTASCKRYPEWIPDEVLTGEGCPEFEAKEPKKQNSPSSPW